MTRMVAAYPAPDATAADVAVWKAEQERAAAAEKRLRGLVRSLSHEQRGMLRRVRDGQPVIDADMAGPARRGADVTRYSLRNMGLLDDVSALTDLGRAVAGRLP